jgi:hypothetical protein
VERVSEGTQFIVILYTPLSINCKAESSIYFQFSTLTLFLLTFLCTLSTIIISTDTNARGQNPSITDPWTNAFAIMIVSIFTKILTIPRVKILNGKATANNNGLKIRLMMKSISNNNIKLLLSLNLTECVISDAQYNSFMLVLNMCYNVTTFKYNRMYPHFSS